MMSVRKIILASTLLRCRAICTICSPSSADFTSINSEDQVQCRTDMNGSVRKYFYIFLPFLDSPTFHEDMAQTNLLKHKDLLNHIYFGDLMTYTQNVSQIFQITAKLNVKFESEIFQCKSRLKFMLTNKLGLPSIQAQPHQRSKMR